MKKIVTIIAVLFVTAGWCEAGSPKGGLDLEVGSLLPPGTVLPRELEAMIPVSDPKRKETWPILSERQGKFHLPPGASHKPDHAPGPGHWVPEPSTLVLSLLGILIVYTGNRKHKII